MAYYWLAILLAAALDMGLGALWYSPLLFGKTWQKRMGKSPREPGAMKKSASRAYVISAVSALLLAFMLAFFLGRISPQTAMGQPGALQSATDGAIIGFLAWLGLVLPASATNAAFEGRSWAVFAIYMGYQLVAMALMGGLLGAWA